MDGPRDYHTNWSKSKKILIFYDVAYMRNLKKWHNWNYLQNRSRFMGIENKLMVTKGEGGKLGVLD